MGEKVTEGTAGFFRTTFLGGVLFLVPIVVLLVVLGKALQLSHQLVAPLSRLFKLEAVAGIPLPRILAVAAVVLFCFLAGLFAKTKAAQRTIDWLESALLSRIPGYSVMKDLGENIAGVKKTKVHEVVLVSIEEAWQIAFVIERMQKGGIVVYVPGAPNPWSGSVYLMTEDRIKSLDVPLASALKCIKQLGIGADALTRGRL